jgi:GNAT superfamily N-acetyltransferase
VNIEIRKLTNRDDGFYALVGPFLARRSVVAEIGGALWDDDDKTWFVAIADGEAVGFCAARQTSTGTMFQSAYVVPGHRREGIYKALLDTRDEAYPGPAKATCSPTSLPALLRRGFAETGRRGRFVRVART